MTYCKLGIAASRVNNILCHRKQRYVGQQLTLSYERKRIIFERKEVSEDLGGQYVKLYDFPDRPLEVRWKGHLLSYRIFRNERVSHTAIVENKRLSHVLRMVKAQQDVHQAPAVETNSNKAATRSEAGRSTAHTMLLRNRLRPKLWNMQNYQKRRFTESHSMTASYLE